MKADVKGVMMVRQRFRPTFTVKLAYPCPRVIPGRERPVQTHPRQATGTMDTAKLYQCLPCLLECQAFESAISISPGYSKKSLAARYRRYLIVRTALFGQLQFPFHHERCRLHVSICSRLSSTDGDLIGSWSHQPVTHFVHHTQVSWHEQKL